MGTFDKYLDKASSMASGLAGQAEKTGRVAQAQLKLRSLQGDAKDANAALGALVMGLVERGELAHPELEPALDKARAAAALVREKEEEIAHLKAEDKAEGKAEDQAE